MSLQILDVILLPIVVVIMSYLIATRRIRPPQRKHTSIVSGHHGQD